MCTFIHRWKVERLTPCALTLDMRQAYKDLKEDVLIRSLRRGSRRFAVRYLPYRLSPVVLGLPGLLLHLTLLVAVHTAERAQWMYAFWVITRGVHLCVDAMDGTQARRNGTQSTARHYWDHWIDLVNAVMAVLIVARLGPSQETSLLPYALLSASGQLFFYSGFCGYFATGIMREPYVSHLWNYVFGLFLGLSGLIFEVESLESHGFQLTYAALSLMTFGLGLWTVLEDFTLMTRSRLASPRFFVQTFMAPLLILGLYVFWLRRWDDTLITRAMSCIAMASMTASIHARQLVNKPPAWLTGEGLLFLLYALVPTPRSALFPQLVLAAMVVMVVRNLIRDLGKLIEQSPEIGFPLVWVSSRHPLESPPVRNSEEGNSFP